MSGAEWLALVCLVVGAATIAWLIGNLVCFVGEKLLANFAEPQWDDE